MNRTTQHRAPIIIKRTSAVRTLLAIRTRNKRRVLVGLTRDGHWASSSFHVGDTIGVSKLDMSVALGETFAELYEVDVSSRTVAWECQVSTTEPVEQVNFAVEVKWRVHDPVEVAKHPNDNHHESMRHAVEGALRELVQRSEEPDLEELTKEVKKELDGPHVLREKGLRWTLIDVSLGRDRTGRLNALQTARRERSLDREHRKLQQDRIDFYSGVINAGQVSLLALWLAEEGTTARDVLDYVRDFDIPTGNRALDAEDPLRDLVSRLFLNTDEFARNELRLALVEGLQQRADNSALSQLRDVLNQTNGSVN